MIGNIYRNMERWLANLIYRYEVIIFVDRKDLWEARDDITPWLEDNVPDWVCHCPLNGMFRKKLKILPSPPLFDGAHIVIRVKRKYEAIAIKLRF